MTIALAQASRERAPQAVLANQTSASVAEVNAVESQALNSRWVVSADEAKQLIAQGATVLDARGGLKLQKPLARAIAVNWKQFAQPHAPDQGKLLDDDHLLTQKLQAVGVSRDKPVIAVGDPARGWGEDGRVVWMLRTLGHQKAVLVDGGYQALVKAGVPTAWSAATVAPRPGDFVVERTTAWTIDRAQLKAELGQQNVVVIDTREAREYAGATPYGEQRGGHIPGALHIYYKDLLDQNGKLLPREQMITKLEQLGVTQDTQVVAYCTGGIRSGWFTSILSDLGYKAKNYAGSMWDWSAGPVASYPLEKTN
ncbi:sulfurtransferase [Leptolyngbya sp. FACHB-261]|nr:sulfurtransferase [Leptolyngbya sp. FACHB-261]